MQFSEITPPFNLKKNMKLLINLGVFKPSNSIDWDNVYQMVIQGVRVTITRNFGEYECHLYTYALLNVFLMCLIGVK